MITKKTVVPAVAAKTEYTLILSEQEFNLLLYMAGRAEYPRMNEGGYSQKQVIAIYTDLSDIRNRATS